MSWPEDQRPNMKCISFLYSLCTCPETRLDSIFSAPSLWLVDHRIQFQFLFPGSYLSLPKYFRLKICLRNIQLYRRSWLTYFVFPSL